MQGVYLINYRQYSTSICKLKIVFAAFCFESLTFKYFKHESILKFYRTHCMHQLPKKFLYKTTVHTSKYIDQKLVTLVQPFSFVLDQEIMFLGIYSIFVVLLQVFATNIFFFAVLLSSKSEMNG